MEQTVALLPIMLIAFLCAVTMLGVDKTDRLIER